MPNPFLERLRRERERVQSEIEAITGRAAEEERDLTAEEVGEIETRSTALAPLDDRLRQMHGLEESRIAYLSDARRVDGGSNGVPPEVTHAGQELPDLRSWGERFSESGVPGEYQRRGHGRSESVVVGSATSPLALRQEAAAGERAIASSPGLGALVPIHLIPGPIAPPILPTMLELVRRSPTSSQVIQYVKEVVESPPPPLPGVTPEGQPKPQLELNFLPETATVGTIAEWVLAMRQILDDLPQLRAYIDGRLRTRLIKAIESFVLNGDTTTGNPGLLAGAGTAAGSDFFDAILAGVEEVEAYGYTPTGIAANGRDWFGFLRNVLDRPTSLGDMVITSTLPYRVMGLPVVVTPAIEQGKVLVGDFADGAELFDRQETQILVADQHADIFIRNQIVVLAEARLALAVYAPAAFVVGEFDVTRRGATVARPAAPQSSPQPARPATGSQRRT